MMALILAAVGLMTGSAVAAGVAGLAGSLAGNV